MRNNKVELLKSGLVTGVIRIFSSLFFVVYTVYLSWRGKFVFLVLFRLRSPVLTAWKSEWSARKLKRSLEEKRAV